MSQWKIVRFRWNSVHYSKCRTQLQSRDQKLKFLEFKMAATAILKIAFFGHNSSTDCLISAKFCVRKQNGMPTKAWRKLQLLKIQDGGRPPFWKSLYHHNSVKNLPILMKFGTQHQILNPITVTWPKKLKFFKFEMLTAAILNIVFLAITH